MTPKLKKLMKLLKTLNAYELATLGEPEDHIAEHVAAIIRALDSNHVGLYGLTAEEYIELDQGRKITAIKMVRERTGLGLADAKNMVDEVQGKIAIKALKKTALTGDPGPAATSDSVYIRGMQATQTNWGK